MFHSLFYFVPFCLLTTISLYYRVFRVHVWDNLDENLSWLLGLPELENKPFVLGEHGWPSDGYIDGVGVASPNNQQQYMKDSYCYLQVDKSYPYYLFTSIDND